jgi:hypothetical protein
MTNESSTVSASGIRLTVGALIGKQLFAAGTPLPYTALEDVPEALRSFVVSKDDDDADKLEPLAQFSFQLGVHYGLDSNGRLRRHARDLARQAAELEAVAQEQELIRETIEDARLPEETVEQLQDSHDADIAQQLAQAEISARRADELHDHLVTQQDEQEFDADGLPVDEQVSPTVEPSYSEELVEEREGADARHSKPRQQKTKKA